MKMAKNDIDSALDLVKAKYISRKKVGGKWFYKYPDGTKATKPASTPKEHKAALDYHDRERLTHFNAHVDNFDPMEHEEGEARDTAGKHALASQSARGHHDAASAYHSKQLGRSPGPGADASGETHPGPVPASVEAAEKIPGYTSHKEWFAANKTTKQMVKDHATHFAKSRHRGLAKAKYISRKKVKGKWVYTYPEDKKGRKKGTKAKISQPPATSGSSGRMEWELTPDPVVVVSVGSGMKVFANVDNTADAPHEWSWTVEFQGGIDMDNKADIISALDKVEAGMQMTETAAKAHDKFDLEKAKYTSRKKVGGKWVYTYPKDKKGRKKRKKLPPLSKWSKFPPGDEAVNITSPDGRHQIHINFDGTYTAFDAGSADDQTTTGYISPPGVGKRNNKQHLATKFATAQEAHSALQAQSVTKAERVDALDLIKKSTGDVLDLIKQSPEDAPSSFRIGSVTYDRVEYVEPGSHDGPTGLIPAAKPPVFDYGTDPHMGEGPKLVHSGNTLVRPDSGLVVAAEDAKE